MQYNKVKGVQDLKIICFFRDWLLFIFFFFFSFSFAIDQANKSRLHASFSFRLYVLLKCSLQIKFLIIKEIGFKKKKLVGVDDDFRTHILA